MRRVLEVGGLVFAVVVVAAGKPVLGPWQAIYFCEFDGPRNRQVLIKVVG